MANPNFGALLDKSPTEVDKPKPLPQGTYTTVIVGKPKYDKSTKKQTEFVEFQHKMISASDDVDAEALKEALTKADGSVRSLADVQMKNTFYITENSLWRLKEFLEHCGFDTESDEQSLREMCEDCTGKTVGVFIKHEPSQDGSSIFARIDKTVVAE